MKLDLLTGEELMMLGISSRERTRSSGSSSFLVRLSREAGRHQGAVRVYLRNLQTGEELYLGDPKRVSEFLANELETDVRDENDETTSEARVG